MLKAILRIAAATTIVILAFRAVGSFLSWTEDQKDSVANSWIDDDEFEEA